MKHSLDIYVMHLENTQQGPYSYQCCPTCNYSCKKYYSRGSGLDNTNLEPIPIHQCGVQYVTDLALGSRQTQNKTV